jgi:hypothetical protein
MQMAVKATIVIILVLFLFSYTIPADFGNLSLFDQLDPRLPGHRTILLSRLQLATGNIPSNEYELLNIMGQSGLNRDFFNFLEKPKAYPFSFAKDDFSFSAGFQIKGDWLGITEDKENISNLQTVLTIKGMAILKDNIEFHQDITLFRADSTENLDDISTTGEFLKDPLLSYPLAGRGPIASSQNTLDVQTDRAFIKTELYGIGIQVGRDRLQFKGGYHSGLLFSGLTRPVDMFYRLDYNVWRFRFTALSGQLTDAGKRYISAKRATLRLARNLQIGATEAVAFADDPTAYINPLILFYLTHRHRPNNEDNLLASFDISYTPMKNLNIYGEFLDDDLILFEGGASKYGFLFGLYKSQLFFERVDFRFEYSYVRKWTYTHVSLVNAWEYRGRPFGFWLGPDTDELFGQLSYFLSPVSVLKINFDYVRKGEGDIYHPYEDEQGDKTSPFPSGVVEKSTGAWLDFRHEFSRFKFLARLGYRFIDNRLNLLDDVDSYFIHTVVVSDL